MAHDQQKPALRADVALARAHVSEAIEQLALLMKASDARISLAASSALLDRAFGKPGASAEAGVEDVGQVYSGIKRVIVDTATDQDR